MFSLPSIFSAIGSDDGVRQLLHALGSAEPPLRRGVVADVEVNHGPDVGGPSRVDLPRRARERTNGSRPSSRHNLACSACGRAICIWPHPGAVPIQLIPCTENILFRGGGEGGAHKAPSRQPRGPRRSAAEGPAASEASDLCPATKRSTSAGARQGGERLSHLEEKAGLAGIAWLARRHHVVPRRAPSPSGVFSCRTADEKNQNITTCIWEGRDLCFPLGAHNIDIYHRRVTEPSS